MSRATTEDPAGRERLRERLRGESFDSETGAGVRDPNFRELFPAVQQKLVGTRYETLRDIYDEVSFADLEDAQRALGRKQRGVG